MIWLVVEYTDGTRVGHAFLEALLYAVECRVHVQGDALCGVGFSGDRSGARRDVVRSLLAGNATTEERCKECLTAEGN